MLEAELEPMKKFQTGPVRFSRKLTAGSELVSQRKSFIFFNRSQIGENRFQLWLEMPAHLFEQKISWSRAGL
jgi:hypothetical protein